MVNGVVIARCAVVVAGIVIGSDAGSSRKARVVRSYFWR